MPDVFSLSLVLTGLWCCAQVLDGKCMAVHSVVAFFTIGAGVLSKSPAGILLVALLPMAWLMRAQRVRVAMVGMVTAVSLLPSIWWYGHWVPHLVRTYGFWHFFMGKDIGTGVIELWSRWPEVVKRYYFDALKFTGFACFLWGIFVAVHRRAKGLLITLASFALIQFVLMLKAGDTFAEHSYYVLPVVPIMAVVAAFGLSMLPSIRLANFIVAVVMIEGLANSQHDLRIPPENHPLLALEPLLDGISSRDDRVVINTGRVPTAMYFAHRKGWLAYNGELQREAYLDSLAVLGCRYVVVLKDMGEGDVSLDHPVVAEDAHFRVLLAVRH